MLTDGDMNTEMEQKGKDKTLKSLCRMNEEGKKRKNETVSSYITLNGMCLCSSNPRTCLPAAQRHLLAQGLLPRPPVEPAYPA